MPGNPPQPAVVHVDLDGAAAIFGAHGWDWPVADDPLFESGLSNALDFFDIVGVRATLFTIARDLESDVRRNLLREAVARGHRIGSHTVTHRRLRELASDDKRREIFESRERLQSVLGVEVEGFRAPEYSIDREVLELVAEAGYRYDSSLFPSPEFAARVAVDRVAPEPHEALPGLWELPLPAHRPMPYPFHPCYSLVLGRWYFRLGLRRHRRQGVPFVLLFHLTDFADPLPPGRIPGWKGRIFTLSHLDAERKNRRCRGMWDLVTREYEVMDTSTLLERS